MKLTINDIAKLANVSKATVSRVINNKPDVNPEMREKIRRIMEDNGYRPNAQAVAIAKKRSFTVAILIPSEFSESLMNEYYLGLVQEMSRKLDEKGFYSLFVYPNSTRCMELMHMNRVDGFIVLSSDVNTSSLVKELAASDIPCVATANHRSLGLACFDIDNIRAGEDATTYLIGHGHKDIAFLNFKSTMGFRDRLEGYRTAMNNAGIGDRIRVIDVESSSSEAAKTGFTDFWKEGNRPSAVFTCNDTAARGVYAACYELGIGIPDDISIISVDDQVSSVYMTPPLTTIYQSIHEKASVATDNLVNYIKTGEKPQSEVLPYEIVQRGSVKSFKSFN